MTGTRTGELYEFLHRELGDDLRSIVRYDRDDTEVIYVRDVDARYDDRSLHRVVRDLEIESLAKEIQEDLYVHGDLRCTVRCFDGGVELHFIEDEGAGVAVAVEPSAFVAQRTSLGKCMELAGIDRSGI